MITPNKIFWSAFRGELYQLPGEPDDMDCPVWAGHFMDQRIKDIVFTNKQSGANKLHCAMERSDWMDYVIPCGLGLDHNPERANIKTCEAADAAICGTLSSVEWNWRECRAEAIQEVNWEYTQKDRDPLMYSERWTTYFWWFYFLCFWECFKHHHGVSFGDYDHGRWGQSDKPVPQEGLLIKEYTGTEGVYVLLDRSTGYRKIGMSNNVGRRCREIAAAMPVAAILEHVYETTDARSAERAAHVELSQERRGGEWFEVSLDDAIKAIA